MLRKRDHLNKSEVGTLVPTSDGVHPSQNSRQNPKKRPQPNRHSKLNYHIPPFWFALWISLFLINTIFGLTAPGHDLLTLFRISGIALCLLYVAKTFPKDYLLLAAMFTTCISDIILAFNNTSEIGLIFFLATQIIHLFRLAPNRRYRQIAIFVSLSILLIILDLVSSIIPLLLLVAGLYAITLTINVFTSFHWHRTAPKNPQATLAFAGFILFACCDICTGISYLSLVTFFPAFLYAPANFLAWFFYYPSQVLISNSGKPYPDKT